MSNKDEVALTEAETVAKLKARLDRWQSYQNTENVADNARLGAAPPPLVYGPPPPHAALGLPADEPVLHARYIPVSPAAPAAPSAGGRTTTGAPAASAAAASAAAVVLPAYRRRRLRLPDVLMAYPTEENRAAEIWSGLAFALVILSLLAGIAGTVAYFFWKG